MRMILIRHAGTATNGSSRLNGKLDEPILPETARQIDAVAQKLPKDIKHIYCSPMLRTKQTAEHILEYIKAPITYHPQLVERDFGQMDGMTWREGLEKFGPNYSLEKDLSMRYDYTAIAGESFEQVKQRVQEFVEFVRSQNPGEPTLVVTHGGIIRALVYLYGGQLLGEMPNLYTHQIDI